MSQSLARLIETRIAAAIGDGGMTMEATLKEAEQLARDAQTLRRRLGPGDPPDLRAVIGTMLRDAGR